MSGDYPKSPQEVAAQARSDSDGILSIEELELPPKRLSIGAHGQGRAQRQYELIAGIAKGGMGEIFIANMSQPGQSLQPVIVKRLLPELRNDSDQLAMFRAEAEVMHRLDHPNIVSIIDDPIIDDTPCLAMEYIEGRNIDQLLTRSLKLEKPLSLEAMLYIMIEVLQGVAHVHNANLENGEPLQLVHRDLTPGNLMVSFTGDVKITDFGISKSQMSRVSTTVGIVKGKARYLAPEQITGEPATPKSDLFACACVCLELITGKPLFDAANVHQTLHSIVHGKRKKVSDILKTREPKLVSAIEKALSTNPKRRYNSATEFCDALRLAKAELNRSYTKSDLATYIQALFEGEREPWESSGEVLSPATPHAQSDFSDAASLLEEDTPQVDERQTLIDEATISQTAPKTPDFAERRKSSDTLEPSLLPKPPLSEVLEDDTMINLSQAQPAQLSKRSRPQRPQTFDTGFKFRRAWPILFATFGLGLATGVIATIVTLDSSKPKTSIEVTQTSNQLAPPPAPVEAQDNLKVKPSLTPIPAPAPASPKPAPAPAVKKTPIGTGKLSIFGPKGSRIRINGKRLRKRVPLIKYELSVGRHRIQISKGRYRRVANVNIRKAKTSTLKFKRRRKKRGNN